jgi:hypothetical protein
MQSKILNKIWLGIGVLGVVLIYKFIDRDSLIGVTYQSLLGTEVGLLN